VLLVSATPLVAPQTGDDETPADDGATPLVAPQTGDDEPQPGGQSEEAPIREGAPTGDDTAVPGPTGPSPIEICGNGVDDNANGEIDEGC
jgi:hypothetical protein